MLKPRPVTVAISHLVIRRYPMATPGPGTFLGPGTTKLKGLAVVRRIPASGYFGGAVVKLWKRVVWAP